MNSTFAGVIRRLYGDIKNFRPAQKSQAFALTTYVLTGCLVLAWPKTFSEFALLLVSNHIIDHVLRRLVFRDARPAAKGQILAPSVIIISCGTFLLLQGYSTWAYLIAGFIGVSSRYIFTVQGQPVFNPANLGVLSIALAFPMLGTSFSDQWVGRGDLIAAWRVFYSFCVSHDDRSAHISPKPGRPSALCLRSCFARHHTSHQSHFVSSAHRTLCHHNRVRSLQMDTLGRVPTFAVNIGEETGSNSRLHCDSRDRRQRWVDPYRRPLLPLSKSRGTKRTAGLQI